FSCSTAKIYPRMNCPKTRLRHKTLTGLTLAALGALTVHAATDWTGATSTDWNTATNWVGGAVPNGADAYINNAPNGNIATISANAPTALGIFIDSGSLNHTAGSISVQNAGWPGGWVIVGGYASATYNLADTAVGGGTFTGYGTGSGSLTTGGEIRVGAGSWWDHATGALNINTSGTLQANGPLVIAAKNGDNGTANIDAGTVILKGGWQTSMDIASGSTTETATGSLNMSGGTVTLDNRLSMGVGTRSGNGADVPYVYANGSNVATLTMTGGTLTTDAAHNNGWQGGLYMATGDGGTGGSATINLNGGTLSTRTVFSGSWNGGTKGTSTFNFNGGTLQASDNRPAWDQLMAANAITHAYVKAGGAVIDTNGFEVWIGQNLEGDLVSTGGGLTKQGLGTLVLTGANTFTGSIHVNAGTLSINSAFIADTASVYLLTGAIFDLAYSGSDTIVSLFINDVAQGVGTYGSLTSTADFKSAFFTGNGLLNVTSAIPEPSTCGLVAGGLVLVGAMVRRRRANA
ncbi:MAG TPA: autotransporter-associated beta strand repeat-containing protein, partial [Roseimicrobium sp.]|nr:autotransporter-associated beta strand repeat-containing protein [Roseimicrobium sp.]